MRLGILAGTFDPVHAGHLTFAKRALEESGLDKIVFMPERRPRRKTNVTDFKHRLAMLCLTADNDPDFEVYDTGEPNFSLASTLPRLKQKYNYDELTILLGSDTAANLSGWQGIEKLSDEVGFLVALRGGTDKKQLSEQLPDVRFDWLESQMPHLTSSQIRFGQADSHLAAVNFYIAEHRLYG